MLQQSQAQHPRIIMLCFAKSKMKNIPLNWPVWEQD